MQQYLKISSFRELLNVDSEGILYDWGLCSTLSNCIFERVVCGEETWTGENRDPSETKDWMD